MSLKEYYQSLTQFNSKHEMLTYEINSLSTRYGPSLDSVIKNAMMDEIYSKVEFVITPAISETFLKFIQDYYLKEGLHCNYTSEIYAEGVNQDLTINPSFINNKNRLRVDWTHWK